MLTNDNLSSEIVAKLKKLCIVQASLIAQQDDFGLYIPVSGSWTPYSSQVFDLGGVVSEFVASDKKVMLILAESGSGKSFFGRSFIKERAEAYEAGQRIPLFIPLASVKRPVDQLMIEALQAYGFTKEEMEALKKTHSFLLFLDAYDETSKTDNFYLTNKLTEWNAKVVFTCRPSYLAGLENYRRCFMPYSGQQPLQSAFQEVYVAPFIAQQINLYIHQYAKVKKAELEKEMLMRSEFGKEWLEPGTYSRWIEELPGLKHLVQNPFLLRITMEVLPNVVIQYEANKSGENNQITKLKLYDEFTRQWFIRQEDKYISSGGSISRTFQKDCLAFAKALAKKMNGKGLTQVYYYEEEGSLDIPGEEDEKKPNEWAFFFSDNMIPEDKGSDARKLARTLARKACPLREVEKNQWAFIHTSILEYFVSREIIDKVPVRPTVVENKSPLGDFALLPKLTKAEADELFKEEGIKIFFSPNQTEKEVILGQGNFGKFFIGRRKDTTKRFVGIKAIYGEENISQSKEEAVIQLQLNGLPNVMPLWHSAEEEKVLYHCMPLAGFGNGEHLRNVLLRQNAILKEKFLVHVAKSLLTGVKGAHNRRVYHLDLKPANFIMDCRGTIYIIDFGCAIRKYDNSRDAFLNEGGGDTRYYSPLRIAFWRSFSEIAGLAQEKSERYNGIEADLWAIGVTLLELQRGSYPFPRVRLDERLRWDTHYFKELFQSSFPELSNPAANSLMAVIKVLLTPTLNNSLTAEEVLKMPVFQRAELELSKEDLEQTVRHIIEENNEIRQKEMIQAAEQSQPYIRPNFDDKKQDISKEAPYIRYENTPKKLINFNPQPMTYLYVPSLKSEENSDLQNKTKSNNSTSYKP